MQKAFGNLQDTSGNAIGSATLTVYDAGTTDLATLYEDDGITGESNPFTIETNGEWAFYAADGDYDLVFSKSGYAGKTLSDFQLLDRASVIAGLQGVTGFDFIQSATPTATAADEWWLDTDDGTVYKSSAPGAGDWDYQYQNALYESNGDFDIDSNTLFVDSSNNRNGFGTSSPARKGHFYDLDNTGFTGIRLQNPTTNVGQSGVEFSVDATYSKAAIYQVRSNANGVGDVIIALDSNNDASNWTTGDNKFWFKTNGSFGVGLSPTANMTGVAIESGILTLKETTTPTADADYIKIYSKSDNKLYFQDGAGTEHEIAFV